MPPDDPFRELDAAVHADDLAWVRRVLEAHPELPPRLDAALPSEGFGSIAIQVAVRNRDRAMVDLLLAAGASIHARSDWAPGGFGVLDETDDPDFIAFLESRGAVMNPHNAARIGRLDVLERLVREDPTAVHFRGGDGQTPLHVAKNLAVARFLVDHGADIDARDVDHESTPAQYLIRDHQDIVQFLVGRGCHTDIMMAAALGDVARVQRFLDEDPSSIYTSVTEHWFPCKAGGTIYNWTLDRYATLPDVARMFQRDAVLALLRERIPDDLRLIDACETGDHTTVQRLVATKPGLIASLTEEQLRRLSFAAQGDRRPAVQLMLEAGWPVAAPAADGTTALHWAGFHGDLDLTRLLLQHGAPLGVRDHHWKTTPLHWTCAGSVHSWLRDRGDHPATAEALLAAGAEPFDPHPDGSMTDEMRQLMKRHAT